jgi:hypothetical protein
MSLSESSRFKLPPGLILFFLIFVIPFGLVFLPDVSQASSRLVGVSLFIFSMTGAIFWFALSPKSKIIRPGGKLNQPQFDGSRQQIERGIRIVIVLFGLWLFFTLTIPFARDLLVFVNGTKPVVVAGTTVEQTAPFLGLWFLEQSVKTSKDGTSLLLFYSLQPLHVGQKYEFTVLPRSGVVLDFRLVTG